MQSKLTAKPYKDDDRLYAANPQDNDGEPPDSNPAIRELQAASRASILRACQNPDNLVVKVRGIEPPEAKVRGYMTIGRFLFGKTPEEFECALGLRTGVLKEGCRVYRVDPAGITADNIGPRYMTSWSAGVSPRDLEVLSQRAGAPVEYHRDFPAASDPIPQFTLYNYVPTLLSIVLAANQRFEEAMLR